MTLDKFNQLKRSIFIVNFLCSTRNFSFEKTKFLNNRNNIIYKNLVCCNIPFTFRNKHGLTILILMNAYNYLAMFSLCLLFQGRRGWCPCWRLPWQPGTWRPDPSLRLPCRVFPNLCWRQMTKSGRVGVEAWRLVLFK